MSKKHYAEYRDELHVIASEHVLQVMRGKDGEHYALCYHLRDEFCRFPVRYSERGRVRVRFFSDLTDAQEFIDDTIRANFHQWLEADPA